jgi:lysophospholipase L1-like esterase
MKRLIALLFGIIVSLIAVEGAVRIIEHKSSSADTSWSDRPRYYTRPELSETMQDYPITRPKPSNVFRLAVVGDSYTFAPYMQFTDAFPKILERMLNLNGTTDRGEVINYGVPAYSTNHEIATVERAIRDEADAILLQITLNDPEIKPYRPKGITVFDSFGKLKLSGWKAFILNHWRTAHFVVTRIHNEKTRRDYISYFQNLFDSPKNWTHFESSLRTLVTTARKANKPIYAAVFPLFGVPLTDAYPFLPCHQKVGSLLAELSVPAIDLFTLYRGIPLDRLQVIPGVDRHPNEIAHRMAAERLYDWLVDEHWAIPESLRIKMKFADRTRIVDEPPYLSEDGEVRIAR